MRNTHDAYVTSQRGIVAALPNRTQLGRNSRALFRVSVQAFGCSQVRHGFFGPQRRRSSCSTEFRAGEFLLCQHCGRPAFQRLFYRVSGNADCSPRNIRGNGSEWNHPLKPHQHSHQRSSDSKHDQRSRFQKKGMLRLGTRCGSWACRGRVKRSDLLGPAKLTCSCLAQRAVDVLMTNPGSCSFKWQLPRVIRVIQEPAAKK